MEWLPGDLFQSKQKNEENIIMTINRERLYVLDVNNIFYRGGKYKTNWSYSHDNFAFYLISSCRSITNYFKWGGMFVGGIVHHWYTNTSFVTTLSIVEC